MSELAPDSTFTTHVHEAHKNTVCIEMANDVWWAHQGAWRDLEPICMGARHMGIWKLRSETYSVRVSEMRQTTTVSDWPHHRAQVQCGVSSGFAWGG